MSRGNRRLGKVWNRALRVTHWIEIASVSFKDVPTIKIPVVTICTTSLTFFLRSAHTVYLCVLYVSENKQRLFPHTALTGRFL